MKKLHYLIAGFLLTMTVGVVMGAKIEDDVVKLCVPGTADTCVITFDTNDGAGNMQIEANSGNVQINGGPLTSSEITDSDIDLGTASDTSRMTVGKATSAVLSGLTRKEGTVHYDTDQDNLVFDDGTDLRPVGSGSGGSQGTNVVANPTFDINVNSWTQSGGTLTQETSSPVGNGTGSARWTPTASGQTLLPDAVVIPDVLNDKVCLTRFSYRYTGGADGDVTAKVVNGGDDLTAAVNLILTPGTSEWKTVDLGHRCPSGSSPRIHLETTVASPQPFFLDDVHTGTDFRIGVTEAAKVTPWESFTPTGSWVTNVAYTGEKRQVGDSLEFRIHIDVSGAPDAVNMTVDIPDGLNLDTTGYSGSNLENLGQAMLQDTSVTGNRTKGTVSPVSGDTTKVRPIAIGGGNVTDVAPFTWASGDTLTMYMTVPIVEFAGDGSQETVTLDTQDWYLDVSIGGAISDNILTDQSFGPFLSSSWDLEVNPGSVAAQITCSGGNAPSGLTCSAGQEQTGIAFDVPEAGRYWVCVSTNIQMDGDNAADSVNNVFSLIETSTTSDVKIGMEEAHVSMGQEGLVSSRMPVAFCDTLHASSAGTKVVKLMTALNGSTSPVLNRILADRLTGIDGNRDINFKVIPISRNFPQAIALTGADETDDLDISSSGDFSAAQPVLKISRSGKNVMMSWDNLAHSSSSAPATAIGFIPAKYRPAQPTTRDVYVAGSTQIRNITVGSDGLVTFTYRDYTGSVSAATSTSSGSTGWVIP